MSFIINPSRFAAAETEANFYQDIVDASLTSGLQFCLDAGSASSYDGSSQKWDDLSGNGQDFFRGADNTATTDDPTFNGTSGDLSSTEYFSFDGGDFFRYDSANETWVNNLQKNNALFSAAFLVYTVDNNNSVEGLFGTRANSNSNNGCDFKLSTGTGSRGAVTISDGANLLNIQTNNNYTLFNAWEFFGLSIDEASGAGGSRLWSNAQGATTFDATYSNPGTGDATYTLELCAVGNNQRELSSGFRIAMAAMWDGVALSAANFSTLSAAMLARFP